MSTTLQGKLFDANKWDVEYISDHIKDIPELFYKEDYLKIVRLLVPVQQTVSEMLQNAFEKFDESLNEGESK